ncbi:MAG: hypothetical protein AVDCRST_MAG12-192, partial [uncultured Rubrobacteraceae bacterium]
VPTHRTRPPPQAPDRGTRSLSVCRLHDRRWIRSWSSRFTSLCPRRCCTAWSESGHRCGPCISHANNDTQDVLRPNSQSSCILADQIKSRAAVQRFHDNHYRYAYEPFIRGFGM